MSTLMERDQAVVANTYRRFPVEVTHGKGSLLWDTDGKRYIDMGSGIGVTAFGIADDAWQAAVTAQLAQVQHTSNLYYTEPCVALAERLCARTGMSRVFFGNSGAEANECAVKVARKYAAEHKGPEYNVIVTLENSFHGRTLTTLAATGQEHFHELFQPLTPGFCHTPANDIEALEALVAEQKVAGILLECVQGEGGVNSLTKAYVTAVAALCEREDIVLMIDEVQTGNGRTGRLFSYEYYRIQPDVVTTAKGLGGGLPLGAVLLSDKVKDVLGFGDHGSTFGGNPVCCAGAVNVLDRLDDDFLAEVRRKSVYVFNELIKAEGVRSVTGMGLMVGIETVRPAADVVAACRENGVLCLTAKHKVRLLPALNIPWDVLKEAVTVLKNACKEG
ncbi:MAG: acetylornithine/succinylornithine family transaminase [Clostridia bacterium]|nr:acetylornithine/succinylornithine family transaminase [Clostridia bacterium]MBR2407315.1 acetylornithine/succinylornithine family transaminase [Clostridia bacterium]